MRVYTHSNENGTIITVSDTHFTVQLNGLGDPGPRHWNVIVSACRELFKVCEACKAKEADDDRAQR